MTAFINKFFSVLFSGIFILLSQQCFADVISISDMGDSENRAVKSPKDAVRKEDLPNPNNQEEVKEFFKKRLENAPMTKLPSDIDLTVSSSVNVVHTQEYYKAKEEAKKPLFQKMYENALKSLHKSENYSDDSDFEQNLSSDEEKQATRFFMLSQQENTDIVKQPQIPTVSFSLPGGRRVLAPALEHIPYFLSDIDVKANGYIKIEDTIVVVANGKKFAKAMQRIFPKFVYGDNNKKQYIDFILEDVQINSTSIPYVIEEIGNDIVLKPKYSQNLENGVYTYTFKYIINNRLLSSEDNVYLDWGITGRPMNTFITSANAIVTIPEGHTFKAAKVIIGKDGKYSANRTNAFQFAKNILGFSNFTPVLRGENMNVMAVMDKNAFINDFDEDFEIFMNNYGKVLYAGLGFSAILIAYVLSFISLKNDRKKNKYSPSYNGSLMRQILVGKYDRVAFVSNFLDLFRKNTLDIADKNGQTILIKNNVSGAKLSKYEKKVLNLLFAKKKTEITVNNQTGSIFKKIKKIFEKANNKQIKKFKLKHNLGYVIFSCSMLIATEIFIALISLNKAQSLIILFSTSVLYALYSWILWHKFKKRWIAVIVKIIALCAIAFVWFFSNIYIGLLTNLMILAMIMIIFGFTRIFAEHNNFINEAKENVSRYKEFLIANADAINLSKDFLNQQSNIYALDIVENFSENAVNKKYNRLEEAENLRRSLIGII